MKKVIILIATFYFFQLSAMEHELSCHAILGINNEASEQEIKKAYKCLKKNQVPSERDNYTLPTLAYSILSHPQAKNIYEQEGLLKAVDFYREEIKKQQYATLELQKTLNDIFDHPNPRISQKKITKLVIQTNATYLKTKAHIKDPIYKKILKHLIDTNIYRLASYFYDKNNFKQAHSILDRHILTISKKNQTAGALISFRDVCIRELEILKQEYIPAEPPSSIKRVY